MDADSYFLLNPEVDAISRMSDLTRSRLEKRGKFPKRVKIGNRKIAWRRSEIMEWARDPEGWHLRSDNPVGATSIVPRDRQPSSPAEKRRMGDYFRGGSSDAQGA